MDLNEISIANIQKSIATGNWRPNIYLSNLSVAQFAQPDDFVAYKVFPFVPVDLPAAKYNVFSKADLARSTMSIKPKFGSVTPAQWASEEKDYSVKVYQGIWGIDQISANVARRAGLPGVGDPRVAKARVAAEQTKLLMDVKFAQTFFKAGVWAEEYAGVGATPAGKQFWQFDNDNSNPIAFFSDLIIDMKRNGRRKPNKLCLGPKTFKALRNNQYILERVKYGGNSANPATVNEKVLAELFGVDQVLVLESTINVAAQGKPADMEYVCDENGALLLYTPASAAIDEPAAGYIFTWDMLGTGGPTVVTNYNGPQPTHTEYVEALSSFDMRQVSTDLAVYLKDCCAA